MMNEPTQRFNGKPRGGGGNAGKPPTFFFAQQQTNRFFYSRLVLKKKKQMFGFLVPREAPISKNEKFPQERGRSPPGAGESRRKILFSFFSPNPTTPSPRKNTLAFASQNPAPWREKSAPVFPRGRGPPGFWVVSKRPLNVQQTNEERPPPQ